MTPTLIILGLLTLTGAAAAMSLRNLVHCALGLVLSFLGLAGIYLHLAATFVGLVQVLVYVGAVAILILFVILLTREGAVESGPLASPGWVVGVGIALLVLGGLVAGIEPLWAPPARAASDPTVRSIGERLMTDYVLPLEVAALLLTAALIGAVLVAMPDRGKGHAGGRGPGPDVVASDGIGGGKERLG